MPLFLTSILAEANGFAPLPGEVPRYPVSVIIGGFHRTHKPHVPTENRNMNPWTSSSYRLRSQ